MSSLRSLKVWIKKGTLYCLPDTTWSFLSGFDHVFKDKTPSTTYEASIKEGPNIYKVEYAQLKKLSYGRISFFLVLSPTYPSRSMQKLTRIIYNKNLHTKVFEDFVSDAKERARILPKDSLV